MGVLRRARAPFERLLLHTPARRRAQSRSVVLLRWIGRHSGDPHERAVTLARDDGRLLTVVRRRHRDAPRARDWWQDFRPEGPGALLLDDLRVTVVGRAFDGREEPDEVAQVLRAFAARAPEPARALGLAADAPVDALVAEAGGFVALVFERPPVPGSR